jgi:hypothetical protein
MAQAEYLLSTLVTGGLLLGVAVAIGRAIGPGFRFDAGPERPSLSRRLADDPRVWMLSFLALVLVFGGGAVVFVGGFELPSMAVTLAGAALVGGTLVVLVGYVFYGTYMAARSRGRPSSMAAAQGATALGTLFLVALVVKLVFLA